MRPIRATRTLAAVAAACLPLTLIAADDETILAEATETLYISAGCPTDATGQCTSTRWLGTTSGDANSNYQTAITPVDHVLYQADGSLQWRDYPSDFSFAADGYLLDDTRDLGVTVTLSSHSQGGAGANTTVHARAIANVTLADGTTTNRTLTAPEQVLEPMTTLNGPVSAEFDIDLPDDLAGATLNRLTVEIAVHGLHARNGYIDQRGGSPVTIPHLVEAEQEPTPAPESTG